MFRNVLSRLRKVFGPEVKDQESHYRLKLHNVIDQRIKFDNSFTSSKCLSKTVGLKFCLSHQSAAKQSRKYC